MEVFQKNLWGSNIQTKENWKYNKKIREQGPKKQVCLWTNTYADRMSNQLQIVYSKIILKY
jgi:hypothetical protein